MKSKSQKREDPADLWPVICPACGGCPEIQILGFNENSGHLKIPHFSGGIRVFFEASGARVVCGLCMGKGTVVS